jgi:phage terminase large subunit-like protein
LRRTRRAIPRRWRDLLTLIPEYDPIETAPAGAWFDADEADRAVRFFPRYLHHVKGTLAGQPLTLEPWQAAATGCLFGWKGANGARRYREAFIYVPR